MKRKFFTVTMVLMLVLATCAACAKASPPPVPDAGDSAPQSGSPGLAPEDEPELAPAEGRIILATTTSTQDSGLLEYLLPVFTRETGWEVDTVAVGTGAAIQMGRDGEADVLLVHSRADEDKFVEDGCAEKRYDVMYNDYVIVGPKDGMVAYSEDVEAVFREIFEQGIAFVSRGDDSGTHKKELAVWKKLDIDPVSNSAYVSAGQGMGATLGMAQELNAYTLSDRATWLTFNDKGDLAVICEKSKDLLNFYGVLPVSKSVSDKINTEGGRLFADWIISPSTQDLIAQFGVEEYGQPLFTPNAER